MSCKGFRYENPKLVDFRSDSADGDLTTCYTGDNGYGDPYCNCNAGSFVTKSACHTGEFANACYDGYIASSSSQCYACCTNGDANMSPTTGCYCNGGSRAGWTCTYGGYASGTVCTTGVWQATCT